MEFTVPRTAAALADSVKAIWCARGTKQEFDAPEPIVPDGCVEIIFNLGDRFINADDRQPAAARSAGRTDDAAGDRAADR